MRSISEKKLKDLYRKNHSKIETSFMKEFFYGKCAALSDAICECKELQEPWMTLEEFLKNPKYEWCWIMLTNKQIHMAYISYNDSENYVFYLNDFDRDESYSLNEITHVMPIHKPEPPR